MFSFYSKNTNFNLKIILYKVWTRMYSSNCVLSLVTKCVIMNCTRKWKRNKKTRIVYACYQLIVDTSATQLYEKSIKINWSVVCSIHFFCRFRLFSQFSTENYIYILRFYEIRISFVNFKPVFLNKKHEHTQGDIYAN